MAIEYVKELWPGRTGTDTFDKHRTYTRTFEVRTTDPADDVVTAGLTDALPRLGQSYPSDPAAVCVSVTPTNSADDPTLWEVVASYDTEIPRPAAAEQAQPDAAGVTNGGGAAGGAAPALAPPPLREENPLERPPQIRLTHETTTEVCEVDWLGKPIDNSAGEPFDPPVMREVSYPVFVVTKNVDSVDFKKVELWVDGINKVPWKGIGPRKCRVAGYDYETVYENGFTFHRVTITIKVRWRGWDARPVDAGYRALETVVFLRNQGGFEVEREVTELVPIEDKRTGAYLTTPAPLDGAGARLPAGEPLKTRGPFQLYREVNFADMGI